MTPQPLIGHEIRIIVPKELLIFLLYANLTGLPVISHITHGPVGSSPNDDVIDHAVRTINDIRKIGCGLPAVINVRSGCQLIIETLNNTSREVEIVQFRIWYDSLLISIADRKPDICLIR
jgi:hypothetical protein